MADTKKRVLPHSESKLFFCDLVNVVFNEEWKINASPVYYKHSALRWTFTLSGAGLSGLVMFVPLMVKGCLLVDICWIFSVTVVLVTW